MRRVRRAGAEKVAPPLDREVLHAAHRRLGAVGLDVDLRAIDEGPEGPHEGGARLHVGRPVDRAPVVHKNRLHRVRAVDVARPPAEADHLKVHDFAQDIHVADAQIRGLQRALQVAAQDAEIRAAAEGGVEAAARPTVEIPHRPADLQRDATPRLSVLPDRTAEGHEALGEVDPQHVHLRLQDMRLPDAEHHAPDQLPAPPPSHRPRRARQDPSAQGLVDVAHYHLHERLGADALEPDVALVLDAHGRPRLLRDEHRRDRRPGLREGAQLGALDEERPELMKHLGGQHAEEAELHPVLAAGLVSHSADGEAELSKGELRAEIPDAAIGAPQLGPLRHEGVNERRTEGDVRRARPLLPHTVIPHLGEHLRALRDANPGAVRLKRVQGAHTREGGARTRAHLRPLPVEHLRRRLGREDARAASARARGHGPLMIEEGLGPPKSL